MKKRIFILLLTLPLLLCGCNPSAPEPSTLPTRETEDAPALPTATAAESSTPKTETEEVPMISIIVGDRTFSATLYENETAQALISRLPMTLNMKELNGNEKYFYLDASLPSNPRRPSGIRAGDIMLYGSDCLVLFYESFSTSYTYTPIGHIDAPAGLIQALGKGNVEVTFQINT